MQSWRKILRKRERWPFGPLGREGFTAFELLIAVSVMAILVAVGMPLFSRAMQTYRLNGATRQVVSEVRMAQSLAVSRGGVYGFHWGGDPAITKLDTEYRIERRGGTTCADWPPENDTTGNADVITEWMDLSREYLNITVQSIVDNGAPFPQTAGGVMFDSRGAAFHNCPGAKLFPLTIKLSNATTGEERCVQTRSAGTVRILDACP